MTYYEQNRERQLRLAREYRERNRAEINRKHRERYANDQEYRIYQKNYQIEYARQYGHP